MGLSDRRGGQQTRPAPVVDFDAGGGPPGGGGGGGGGGGAPPPKLKPDGKGILGAGDGR